MANQITLTEADYKAINEFLANYASDHAGESEGVIYAEEDDITLENGMQLYLYGTFSGERTCTYRGDYYQPAEYRDDITFNIKEASAWDVDGEAEHPVALDWRKITTDYAID